MLQRGYLRMPAQLRQLLRQAKRSVSRERRRVDHNIRLCSRTGVGPAPRFE